MKTPPPERSRSRLPQAPHITIAICLCAVAALLASGCAALNETRFANLLGTEKNLIHLAYNIAEELEKQAHPPLIPRHPEQPILTTTFVDNNNLDGTSKFSRILQEHLASRLVQLGYTVREIKLRQELEVAPQAGERILSRHLGDLQQRQHAQAISVGTYSISDTVIYISARMIDPTNANIISSVDYKLRMDRNIMAMFGIRPDVEEGIIPVEEPRQSFMTRLLY